MRGLTCGLTLLSLVLSASLEAGEPPIFGDTGQRLVLTPPQGSSTVLGAVTLDLDGGRPDLVLWGFNWIQAFPNAGSQGAAPWFQPGPGIDPGGDVMDVISVRLDADPQPELVALIGDFTSANLVRLDYVAGPNPGFVLGTTLLAGITQAQRLATPFGNDRAMPVAVLRSGVPHWLLEQRFGSSGVQSMQVIPIDLGSFNALGAVSAFIDGDASPELLIYGPGGLRLYSDRIPPLLGTTTDIPTVGFDGPLAIGLAARGAAVDIGVGKMGGDSILVHNPQSVPLGAQSWSSSGQFGVLPTNAVLGLDADQDEITDLLFIREGENSLHLGRNTSPLPYDPIALSFGSGGRAATTGAYLDPGVDDLVIVNAGGQAELWRARERAFRAQLRISDGPPWTYHLFGLDDRSPVHAVLSPIAADADMLVTVRASCTDLAPTDPQVLADREITVTINAGQRYSERLPLAPPQVERSECRYSVTNVQYSGGLRPRRADRPGLARYEGRASVSTEICEPLQNCGLCAFLPPGCGSYYRCRQVPTAVRGQTASWSAQIFELPRRLRDENLESSAGGRYYIERYYSYSQLAVAQMLADPVHAMELAQRVAFGAAPLIINLLDEDGSATIPATLVADTEALYLLAREQADAVTQQSLDADWALLNLQGFAGQSVASFSSHIGNLTPDPMFADGFE
jgi:hypothetical protein